MQILQAIEADLIRDYKTAQNTKLTTPRLAFAILYNFTIRMNALSYGLNQEQTDNLLAIEDVCWNHLSKNEQNPMG